MDDSPVLLPALLLLHIFIAYDRFYTEKVAANANVRMQRAQNAPGKAFLNSRYCAAAAACWLAALLDGNNTVEYINC